MLFQVILFIVGAVLLKKYIQAEPGRSNWKHGAIIEWPAPGPKFSVPLFGHLFSLGEYPQRTFLEWGKLYGPVFSVQMGSFPSVVINDASLIRKAFSSPFLALRPRIKYYEDYSFQGQGLLGAHEDSYRERRTFFIKNVLKDFAAQGDSIEERILQEVKLLGVELGAKKGVPITIHDFFNRHILNSLLSVLVSMRFEPDDPRFNELLHGLNNLQDPSNFLDMYLSNSCGTTDYEMTDEALLVVLRDLLIGTGETVGSALEFAILHIALNPSVQHQLRAEIERAVGQSRRPLYGDRNSMPYTQATILEILRHGSVVSPGERLAVEDNTIDGAFYPKGTVLRIKHYEIHQSKELWEDPEVFRPERFLNREGTRLENKGKVIPFGYGRRFCVGETLAQTVLFMFVTALVQGCSLEIPKESPLPSSLDMVQGQARSPVPYWVRVTARNDACSNRQNDD